MSAGHLDSVFHPWTRAFLGTFFAAVPGRYQRQNDKGVYGEYNQHNQQGQREIAYQRDNAGNDRDEPERNDDRDVLLEFFIETFDCLFGAKPRRNAPVPARACTGIEISAVRADKNHNPDGSGDAVRQICNSGDKATCRAAVAHD